MRRRTRTFAGLGTMCLLLSGVEAGRVSAAFPGRNGPIYCTSNRTGTQHIFAGIPVVDDNRQFEFYGKGKLPFEGGELLISRAFIPVIVQPDFTDGDSFGMICQFTDGFNGFEIERAVGMKTYRSVDSGVIIRQF